MRDGLSYTKTQLAQLLGVSVPTISTAIDEGAPGVTAAGGRGKQAQVDGKQFVPWYLERERARARAEVGGKSLNSQERELDIDLKREKLMRERKELVPKGAFVATVRDVLARLSVGIDQMPEREAESVIGLRDRGAAVAALQLIGDQLRADLRAPERWMPPDTPQLELSA